MITDKQVKILMKLISGGKKGHLIVTKDDERGGISFEMIDQLIRKIF